MNGWDIARWIKEFVRVGAKGNSRRVKKEIATLLRNVEHLEDRCVPIVGSLGDATVVGRGAGYDGVVQVGPYTGGLHATGSLLYTGRHILTAAHVASKSPDKEVTFQMKRGITEYDILIPVPANAGLDTFQVTHPAFTGNVRDGYDMSIWKLTDPEPGYKSSNRFLVAPFGANKFELATGVDEIGKPFTMIGYGAGGKGATGSRPNTTVDPKRIGENTFDVDPKVYRNEIQSLEVRNATGGTFTLSFDGAITAPIAFDAAADKIQLALEAATDKAMATPLNGHVRVRGGASAKNIFFIEFMDAAPPVTYAGKNVSEIIEDDTNLVGVGATATIYTRVNGNAAGISTTGISLGYDFDKEGTTAQDAIGLYYGKDHLGLGDARESSAATGDSGGPALIDGKIAGIMSAATGEAQFTTPDYDRVRTNSSWGERAYYTRVSPFVGAGNFLTDTLEPTGAAGNYHIVLDMNFQGYGKTDRPVPPPGVGPSAPDDLTITAKKVGDNLVLSVAGGTEASLNKDYYTAPASKILSLTIRGSTDNETFVIEGPLGLGGTDGMGAGVKIDLVGRGGEDKFVIGTAASGLNDFNAKVYVNGGTGNNWLVVDDSSSTQGREYFLTKDQSNGKWDGQISRKDQQPIYHYDVNAITLDTGSKEDIVSVNDANPKVNYNGYYINTRGGNDIITVGVAKLDDIQARVLVDAGAGTEDVLVVIDNQSDAANSYTLGPPTLAGGWEGQVKRSDRPEILHFAVEDVELLTGDKVDTVSVTATHKNVTEGTFVHAGDGDDIIKVGGTKGLDDILSTLNVDGQAGKDTLTFDNQAAATPPGHKYKLTTAQDTGFLTRDPAGAKTKIVEYQSIETPPVVDGKAITFRLSDFGDELHLAGTSDGTTLRLLGGMARDRVVIDEGANFFSTDRVQFISVDDLDVDGDGFSLAGLTAPESFLVPGQYRQGSGGRLYLELGGAARPTR